MRCWSDDRGSTIPLILGCFLLAMVMVAGSVAAGNAFVQQRDLQSVCDGAAAAAATSADLGSARGVGDVGGHKLRLADVQQAVDSYRARDASRGDVSIQAALSEDARTVNLLCLRTSRIAFGSLFGYPDGVQHRAASSAQSPLTQ
ncbi:MAG: pilus assembly protein TadG-related protein [Actinomycetota bacterium]